MFNHFHSILFFQLYLFQYKVSVSKSGTILDVFKALSELNDVPPSRMTATDTYNCRYKGHESHVGPSCVAQSLKSKICRWFVDRFHKVFRPTDGLRGIYEKEVISVFESPEKCRMLPLYLRHVRWDDNVQFALWREAGVATSRLALRWMRDSPRTGCARRTTPSICGANKQ